MGRSHIAIVAAATAVAFTLGACSDEDQNDAEEAANSLAERAEDVASSIAEEAEDVASSIAEEAEDVVASAASAVEEAAGEAATDIAEAAVRNLATERGEEQFAEAGHALDDEGLRCQATADEELESVEVTCTGTTEDGGSAELTGTTDELPGQSVTGLEGTFTGTVDGAEVFTADRLGG